MLTPCDFSVVGSSDPRQSMARIMVREMIQPLLRNVDIARFKQITRTGQGVAGKCITSPKSKNEELEFKTSDISLGSSSSAAKNSSG